jgi:V/A-type H+-transporting ATPase subunit C
MRSLARYATTNAITRTMLSELLTKEDFDSMVSADSLQTAWLALRKTAYEVWVPEDFPGTVLGAEKILREATALRFRRSIHALAGRPHEVGTLLLARWDLDNLEFALRLWYGKDTTLEEFLTYPSLVHDIPVYDVAEAETVEEIALSSSVKVYREKRSVFFVEVALERDYYRRLLRAIRDLGGKDTQQAERIVSAEIDMLNLSWLTRLVEYHKIPPSDFSDFMIRGPSEISRKLADVTATSETLSEMRQGFLADRPSIEGEEVSALSPMSLMEDMMHEMAVDVARKLLSGYPFSIGCVFAFYLLKRIELKNLYSAFSGKALGSSHEEISARLFGLR